MTTPTCPCQFLHAETSHDCIHCELWVVATRTSKQRHTRDLLNSILLYTLYMMNMEKLFPVQVTCVEHPSIDMEIMRSLFFCHSTFMPNHLKNAGSASITSLLREQGNIRFPSWNRLLSRSNCYPHEATMT